MRKYLTWMTHYKLINFSQKEALTWKEKFEQEAEIKKLKEQRVAQEAEEARVKNEERHSFNSKIGTTYRHAH